MPSLGLGNLSHPRSQSAVVPSATAIPQVCDPAPRPDTLTVDSAHRVRPATWRRSVSLCAVPVFCSDCLQRLDIQRLLRHHLFQPPVFLFQLAQCLHVADCQAGVCRLPRKEGGIQHAVLPAQVLNTVPGLSILQHRDELLLGRACSSHRPSPLGP